MITNCTHGVDATGCDQHHYGYSNVDKGFYCAECSAATGQPVGMDDCTNL